MPYPCIGSYWFLEVSITEQRTYPEIVRRLREGQRLLDLGAGIGQDLRHLASDNVPVDTLCGLDLIPDLWNIGFELFKDKAHFDPSFIAHNFFDKEGVLGLELGSFDIIHAADFLHLFSWEEQVTALSRMISLLKQTSGSIICGRHVATKQAMAVPAKFNTVGTEQYFHTGDSFLKLLDDVKKVTGARFTSSVEVYTYDIAQTGWDRRMRFSVELTGRSE